MRRPLGVLLLASGGSRRFGSDKRLARLPGGLTLLEHMVAVIEQAGLPYRISIRRCDRLQPAHSLELETASLGMGSSIAEAVSRLRGDFAALMILPVDLPLLRSDTLLALAAGAAPDTLRRPVFEGQPGHPVVFGGAYFSELQQLTGEEGARAVLRRHAARLEELHVDDRGVCCDIDTPEALQALIEQGAL